MKATAASAALFFFSSHTAGAGRSSHAMAWITTPPCCADTTATSGRCSSNSIHRTRRTPCTQASALAPSNEVKIPEAADRRRLPSLALLCSSSIEDVVVPDKGQQQQPSLFIFGVGYVATALALTFLRTGWIVHGTCTDPRKVKSLGDQGIKTYIFDDWSGPMMQPEPLEALAGATCVLSTVPPSLQSGTDPVLVAHEAELKWAHRNGSLRWVGYLSSTGVYGDRGGGWVTEEDEPWPAAPRTKARLKAERSWLRLHDRDGLPAHVFRLAGIYGPGRSALDAVARHSGDIRLAGSDDGTMVSRIHVADIVSVVEASIERPEPGMVMNVADDLPSTRYETLAYGCRLLGYPRQDPDPSEKYVNRRGGGNKRVDNTKMQTLLAASERSLTFPDYRVGLRALHDGDGRPFSQPTDTAVAEKKTISAAGQSPTRRRLPAMDAKNDGFDSSSAAAELRTLSMQVSHLQATVDKVLAVVGSAGAEVASVNDDRGAHSNRSSDFGAPRNRGEEEGEGGQGGGVPVGTADENLLSGGGSNSEGSGSTDVD